MANKTFMCSASGTPSTSTARTDVAGRRRIDNATVAQSAADERANAASAIRNIDNKTGATSDSRTNAASSVRKIDNQTINSNAPPTSGGTRGTARPHWANEPTNSYTHQTDNVVTGTGTGGTFEKIDLKAVFQPNVLDNYDAVTYHWKLFIVDPTTASNGEVFKLSNQTIIAESGVTDLTIDNVQIRGITAPSVESGTGVMTNVTFDVTEPGGAGMIDKLFYESVALGIGNWATMPVYLQLSFKGRDPETSSPDDGSPGELSSMMWLWPLKISGIKVNVTHVGSKYEFIAIIYNEFSQGNATCVLKHNVTLNNIKTFREAMAELEQKLNDDQLISLLHNYSIPDSFRIIVDPEVGKAEITPNNKNTNPRRNDNYVTFENKNATITVNTGIDKVIDSLLAQTDKYQKSMLNADTPGEDGKPMNSETSQMKKFWRIITESRPLGFDARRQTNAHEHTFYVIEYDIGILDNVASQSSSPPITLAAERKRLMTYIDKKILKKKYNYIFTGLNDQIINFDMTINNAYAVALARFGGVYSNLSIADKGVVTHKHASNETELVSKIGKVISLQNNAKTENSKEVESAIADARLAIANADLSSETKSRFSIILANSKAADRVTFTNEIRAAGGLNNDGTLNAARARATSIARPVTEKLTQQQLNFISNVDISSVDAKSAYTDFAKYSKGKLRPIARMETTQDRQVGLGIESNSNSGLQKLSSMFAVALHSGMDSSFQKVKLTIKGDPFWLFPQPTTDKNSRIFKSLMPNQLEAIELIKNGHKNLINSANLHGTDNFILIRFRSPRIYNIDENEDNSNPNADVETFSGVFRVIEVRNKFHNGRFEQELDCQLDPEIRVLNILDQIETDAKTTSKPTSIQDLTTTNKFPLSSIKTQKIMGDAGNLIEGFQIRTLASNTLTNQLTTPGAFVGANIPSSVPSLISGLPNTFG